MKGHPEVIAVLNKLFVGEVTARQQYFAHYQMAENWGLMRLKAMILDRANDEYRHAEMLSARILFLEGQPAVSQINTINTGNAVPLQFSLDKDSEVQAIADYRAAIPLVESLGDFTTGKILRAILADEEDDHLNEIEAQEDQIAIMGIGPYLATLVKA